MAGLDDAAFLALARRAGYPTEELLQQLLAAQEQQAASGQRASLFDLARVLGVLEPDRARRFERWADQVSRKAPEPLSESGEFEPRVIHESAASLAEAAASPSPETPAAPLAPARPASSRPSFLAGGARPPSERLIVRAPAPAAAPLVPQAPAAPAAPPTQVAAPLPPPLPPLPPAPPTVEAAPAAPAAEPRDSKTSARRKLTASSARSPVAPGARSSARIRKAEEAAPRGGINVLALGAGGAVAVAAIIMAVVVAVSSPQPPPPPPSAPPESPPIALAPPKPTPPTPARRDDSRDAAEALSAIGDAERREKDGRESDAVGVLDGALEHLEGEPRRAVEDARERILGRFRTLTESEIKRASSLSLEGKASEAAAVVSKLRARVPVSLSNDLEAQLAAAKANVQASRDDARRAEDAARDSQDERDRAAARIKEREDAAAPAAPERPAARYVDPAARRAKRKAEIDRLGKVVEAVTVAIGAFSPAQVKTALDSAAPFETPDVDSFFAYYREVGAAFVKFAQLVRTGTQPDVGKDVAFELEKGERLTGKIVSVRDEALVFRAKGAKEDRTIGFGELSRSAVLGAAARGGKTDPDAYYLGAAVWLGFTDRVKPALEALAKASQDSTLARFLKAILEDMGDDEGGPPAAPGSAVPPEVGTGPGITLDPKKVKVKVEKPLTAGERKAALEAVQKAGGWALAYSSKYYDFFSNGTLDEVKDLGARMDLMCDEYRRIFAYKDSLGRPFPIWLYKNHREFMKKTEAPDGVAGFYDGEKIVAFHGSYYSLTTESVLFHEGTHQFQGLVFGDNLWRASLWFIEGLAVYFESSQVEGKHLLTDQIPKERLATVKRAFRSGDFVPLAELIRTDHKNFTAFHYAHAWSLIYFLCYGANGGMERLKKYYEGVKAGKDGVKLFEELFNKPMSQIEAAWKQYIENLAG